MESIRELLIEEMADLYDAEKQLVKALPKMAKAASNSSRSFILVLPVRRGSPPEFPVGKSTSSVVLFGLIPLMRPVSLNSSQTYWDSIPFVTKKAA